MDDEAPAAAPVAAVAVPVTAPSLARTVLPKSRPAAPVVSPEPTPAPAEVEPDLGEQETGTDLESSDSVPPAPRYEPSFPSGPPLHQASPEDAETMDRSVDDSFDGDGDSAVDLGPPVSDLDEQAFRPTLISSPALEGDFGDSLGAEMSSAPDESLPFENTVDARDPDEPDAFDDEADLPFVPPTGQTPAPMIVKGKLANLTETADIARVETDRPRAAEPADSGMATLLSRPPTDVVTPAPIVRSATRDCTSCGAIVPDGFKFCGVCGARYDEVPVAHVAPAVEHGAAILVMVHPDGTDGDSFALGSDQTPIGRDRNEPLFAQDPFLSPMHATFRFDKGQLFVKDEDSLNGIFLRIKAEVELFHCDMFRVGQQLLRFEEMSQVRPIVPGAGDGTTVMGSPVRGCWGRLASIVGIDTAANVWPLRKPETHIGRERGDVKFPEDGFVSGSHSKVSSRDGRYFLADLDSTNGTYLRIKGEGLLASGDLLLLGQQLFRVEIG